MLLLKRTLPVLIIAASIAVFVVLKVNRAIPKSREAVERTWRVTSIIAQPGEYYPSLTLYGQVESPDILKVVAPAKSRVAEMHIREGNRVVPNQLMCLLDSRDFEPDVARTTARIKELEAELAAERIRHASNRTAYQYEKSLVEIATSGVQRAETMKARELGSQASLDQARQTLEQQKLNSNARKLMLDDHRANMNMLEARRQQAQAEQQTAQLNLERSRMVSPFNGWVAKVDVAVGDQVSANQMLFTVYPRDTLEVRAMIPAPYQTEIELAVGREEQLSATIDMGPERFQLALERLSGEADTRGVDALFSMRGNATALRLGRRVTLQLRRPRQAQTIAIPYEALYENNRVYLIDNQRLRAVTVEVLGEHFESSERSWLLVRGDGIQSGDRILTTHLPNALQGLKVSEIEAAADSQTQ